MSTEIENIVNKVPELFYGTQEGYNNKESKEQHQIHFTDDTHRIYVGEKDFSNPLIDIRGGVQVALHDHVVETENKLNGVSKPLITKGFYIWDIDINNKLFVLSTTRRYNADDTENERTWTEEDSALLRKWLDTDVSFDGRKVLYDEKTNPEGIGSQYVSYDIGNFFSLYSKIKLKSDLTIDVNEHMEHISKGEILLDKLPTSAEKGFDNQGDFLAILKRDKDFIIYAPLSPDAGSIELYHNQFQQGYGTAVGNGSASMCGESASLGPYSFTAGRGNTAGYGAAAFGFQSIAFANHSFVQGTNCNVEVNATNGSAFGHGSITSGLAAFSTGHVAKAKGKYSFAQGSGTKADFDNQAVFGKYNASGNYAIIVGKGTEDANRSNAHTLDWNGNAIYAGNGTFGGSVNVTSKLTARSIDTSGTLVANKIQHGANTTASGTNSFAGGSSSTSSAGESLAFGYNCLAAAAKSVSLGHETTSLGHSSLSAGQRTIAGAIGQLVIGKCNIPDVKKDSSGRIVDEKNNPVNDYRKAAPGETYKFIIGNGSGEDTFSETNIGVVTKQNRKNIHTVDGNGNAWYFGKVTAQGTPTEDNDLTTKKFVVDYVAEHGGSGGSGGSVFVDSALSTTSKNPVQNKIITNSINSLTATTSTLNENIIALDERLDIAESLLTELDNSNIQNGAGSYSAVLGTSATANGHTSFSFGVDTYANGNNSFAHGSAYFGTDGDSSIYELIAEGEGSHAEGHGTLAAGGGSHSEGWNTRAYGWRSHTEGGNNIAYSGYSHVEGIGNIAGVEGDQADGATSNRAAHAEGYKTLARGRGAHSEGHGTIAACNYQHVQGKFNIADVKRDSLGNMLDANDNIVTDVTLAAPGNKYALIVGNGHEEYKDATTGVVTPELRSNAHTLDWSGNAWYAGKVETPHLYSNLLMIEGTADIDVANVFNTFSYKNTSCDFIELEITYDDGTTKTIKLLGAEV